jgi:hypothetical protein
MLRVRIGVPPFVPRQSVPARRGGAPTGRERRRADCYATEKTTACGGRQLLYIVTSLCIIAAVPRGRKPTLQRDPSL